MKNKKMLLSLLAVGILALSGCGPKTSEQPSPTPQPTEIELKKKKKKRR